VHHFAPAQSPRGNSLTSIPSPLLPTRCALFARGALDRYQFGGQRSRFRVRNVIGSEGKARADSNLRNLRRGKSRGQFPANRRYLAGIIQKRVKRRSCPFSSSSSPCYNFCRLGKDNSSFPPTN
jgi:hypothetical protein